MATLLSCKRWLIVPYSLRNFGMTARPGRRLWNGSDRGMAIPAAVDQYSKCRILRGRHGVWRLNV